jgi:hypothetical protein
LKQRGRRCSFADERQAHAPLEELAWPCVVEVCCADAEPKADSVEPCWPSASAVPEVPVDDVAVASVLVVVVDVAVASVDVVVVDVVPVPLVAPVPSTFCEASA